MGRAAWPHGHPNTLGEMGRLPEACPFPRYTGHFTHSLCVGEGVGGDPHCPFSAPTETPGCLLNARTDDVTPT